jgi:hypothetical protein
MGPVEYGGSALVGFDGKDRVVCFREYRGKMLHGQIVERARNLSRQICEPRGVKVSFQNAMLIAK